MVEMIRERIDKRLHTTQRVRLMKKDGSAFWGELTLIPGCEDGSCTLIGLVRNVEAEVAYQAAELQRSRLHALGELAGGMAHEINNLLQPACLNMEDSRRRVSAGQPLAGAVAGYHQRAGSDPLYRAQYAPVFTQR